MPIRFISEMDEEKLGVIYTLNVSKNNTTGGVYKRHKTIVTHQGFETRSKRWKILFELAAAEGITELTIISFIENHKAGTDLSQELFPFQRAAKLLATTEKGEVDETKSTKADLVSWNRQAILAMIEVAKKEGDTQKIERGYKAIEIINILFPEFLIESPKSSPFPRW